MPWQNRQRWVKREIYFCIAFKEVMVRRALCKGWVRFPPVA